MEEINTTIRKYGFADTSEAKPLPDREIWSERALSSGATKGDCLTVSVGKLGDVSGFSERYYLVVASEEVQVYNYPNPLSDLDWGITIVYFPPRDAEVRIYDVFGNLVRKLDGKGGPCTLGWKEWE